MLIANKLFIEYKNNEKKIFTKTTGIQKQTT